MALQPALSLAPILSDHDVYELEGSPIPVEIDGKEIQTWPTSLQLHDGFSTSSRLNEHLLVAAQHTGSLIERPGGPPKSRHNGPNTTTTNSNTITETTPSIAEGPKDVSSLDSPLVGNDGVQYNRGSTTSIISYDGFLAAGYEELEGQTDTQSQVPTNGAILMDNMYDTAGKGMPSYYFPPDPSKPSWTAFTMSWTYLTCLIACSIALAIGQEMLYRKSERQSGLLRFKSAQGISKWNYFLWRYAPTILTVNYGIAFQAVDAQIRRLEPFYRLARKTGATAAESIGIDPTKPWAIFSMPSPRTFLSTIALLIAVLAVPTLQNASLSVTRSNEADTNHVYLVSGWSRALTSAFLLNAACTAMILFYTRKGSGLWDDPRGIMGHCAMVTKSHILTDMHGLETSNDKAILNALRHRRYILHQGSLWPGEYIHNAPVLAPEQDTGNRRDTRQPMLRPVPAGLFLALQAVVLILVPILTFSAANYLLQQIPWILTALGVTVKLIWSILDGTLRSLEPWYRLSRRHASASILSLDYTATPVYYLPFEALRNKHYLLVVVSAISLLTEVLIVCLSSFGIKGSAFLHRTITTDGVMNGDTDDVETFASFWWSFGISITILALMMIGTLLVFYHRHRFVLPRAPGTIASTMAYVHQGKLLYDFVDTEKMSKAQRLKHMDKLGKTYGFGWYLGRNLEVICGIDEEPLLQSYQHGVEFKTSMLQP